MEKAPKKPRIEIRTTSEAKRLLKEAALLNQQSVSEFLLHSGLSAAALVLSDRRQFSLDDEQWATFVNALEAAPKPCPRLERLLSESGVFD
jgi:uncharacterized protein (DUF1778 family)